MADKPTLNATPLVIEGCAGRAHRVLAGTQTGRYTKRMLARDVLALVEMLRISYPATAVDCLLSDLSLEGWAGYPPPWFCERLREFRNEVDAERIDDAVVSPSGSAA